MRLLPVILLALSTTTIQAQITNTASFSCEVAQVIENGLLVKLRSIPPQSSEGFGRRFAPMMAEWRLNWKIAFMERRAEMGEMAEGDWFNCVASRQSTFTYIDEMGTSRTVPRYVVQEMTLHCIGGIFPKPPQAEVK